MKNTLFEKYADLIRKRAHEYSEKYSVDYSELESQGFLIYCECLQKYDVTKSKFCTYLYIQLNRLGDFAKTYRRQKGVLIQDYYSENNTDERDYEQELTARESSPQLSELLKEAEQELSKNAFDVLVWIVKREWERKQKRTPTILMAVKHFNCAKDIIEQAWKEIGVFWNRKGFAFYC